MSISENKSMIDETYARLSRTADEVYEFVILYNDYIYQTREYIEGEPIKMVEVHTLTMIEDHPGITVSELAALWKRTKGTVSVNVTALEKKGYIYKQKENNNAKSVHLYPTEKGIELSTTHKVYDNLEIVRTQADLMKSCTPAELDAFHKVIHAYLGLFEDKCSD